MTEQSAKEKSPLLPDLMEQGDFFVCDIFDAAPKGDMASMEHPIFSVSTKPDLNVRRYENGKQFVEVTPSVKGLATVHDRSVLIFCISQIMAALNDGKEVSQTLRFVALDLLTATNRGKSGRGYQQLLSAFERLRGTTVTTNIMTGDQAVTKGFGLIESFEIIRKGRDGRMQEIEIKLSDWVFNAIRAKEVLTLHRDYFRLRKPLERRIYEIGRKHCGQQREWSIGLVRLREKCGSNSTKEEFRRLLKAIVTQCEKHHHMPDYDLSYDDENDKLTFINRRTPAPRLVANDVRLDPETYHDARTVAPGWDIHFLEQEWRNWMAMSDEAVKSPNRAFIGFCRKWYERKGAPS